MDVGACRVDMVGLALTSPIHFCPIHWVGQKCVGEVREWVGQKCVGKVRGRAVMNGAKHCREGQINLEYNQVSTSHKLPT